MTITRTGAKGPGPLFKSELIPDLTMSVSL